MAELAFLPGATTLGVIAKDAVILASEKRVAYGYLVLSKSAKKVFKLSDWTGAACAGLVADMQILTRQVSAYATLLTLDSSRRSSVASVGKIMANILFERRLFPLLTQTIIGGMDAKGPAMYVLDPLGSLLPDKYASVGSGSEIAMGILESGYKDNLTVQEAKDLVLRCIKAGVARDVQSGDGADFLVLSANGAHEETLNFK